jgi:polyisoprenoid-binding protein YceI
MPWQIDNSHTHIQFTVRHMMLSKVRGSFEKFSGSVNFDETNPANTSVEFQLEAASITTGDPKRDGHLRSPDFFNAEAFPSITFASKKVVVTSEKTAVLTGDMTIRGLTREVNFDVEYLGMSKSPWGTQDAGFEAKTRILREDWDLTWNVALETGGWLVGKEIDINIELELIKQPDMETAAA